MAFNFGLGILPDLGSQMQAMNRQSATATASPQMNQTGSGAPVGMDQIKGLMQKMGLGGQPASSGAPYQSDLGSVNYGGSLDAPASTAGTDAAAGSEDAAAALLDGGGSVLSALFV